MIPIFHSDRFVPQLPEGHRFPISKYQLIREQLLYEGTIQENQLEESEPCEESAILQVHSREYWNNIKELTLSSRDVRRIGFPQSPELVNRSRRSCQGTFTAALAALKTGIGMNIAGGTHHAYTSHGEGFCILNDIAIAANHLMKHCEIKKILVVDLDVHQGNGTAKVFQEDARVFTFSMHGKDNYPLQKEESDLDIPLKTGIRDDEYLSILKDTLPRLIETEQPEFVFFQAGVDVLESDKLGKLSLSKTGCKTRDKIVLETCHHANIPLAVAIGGGYSHRLYDTVTAHTNTFRAAMEVYE
ncbi:UNVERIFIED_CONTAM: hypothetical protein GTU68_060327 [Idotea baltica]|nr:hypothetical protein [Idotea baltica]